MTVWNWFYAWIPFILFCFIAVLLTYKRFRSGITYAVWSIVILLVSIPHIVVLSIDKSPTLLLSLLPVTAYLPIIITYFVLSKRNLVSNLFVMLLDILSVLSVKLFHYFIASLYVINNGGGQGSQFSLTYELSGFIASLLAALGIGLAVIIFLRKACNDNDILENKVWYILPALFLLTLLSSYQMASLKNPVIIAFVLALDICVLGIIFVLLISRSRQKKLAKEIKRVEGQIAAEREEYALMRQTLEMGRRYRHDMRHHFSVIQGLLSNRDYDKIGEYVDGLSGRLSDTENIQYCKAGTINAVLSVYAEKAKQQNIIFDAAVSLPESLFIDETELCSILSNAVDNAVNACIAMESGEKKIEIFTEYTEERLSLIVINTVKEEVKLGENGLPITIPTEEHGWGLSSILHIARKYGGMVKCKSEPEKFTLAVVLFAPNQKTKPHKKTASRTVLHSSVVIPAFLLATVLSLNCLPGTMNALEEVPVLGQGIEIIDFRTWGWQWGDSQLDIQEPVTKDETVNGEISNYVEECLEKFNWYYQRKYDGYVAAEFSSREIMNTDRVYIVRMSYILYAGSSAEYSRYLVVDKAENKIMELSDLFVKDSDWNERISGEILRQMEERVEQYGDFFYGFGIFADEPNAFKALSEPNFYLDTNYQLVIEFAEQEIAPGNMGTVSFTIPKDILEDILKENSLLAEEAIC